MLGIIGGRFLNDGQGSLQRRLSFFRLLLFGTRGQLLKKLFAKNHRSAVMISALPGGAALAPQRRSVGFARRPPTSFRRHLMLFDEIQSLAEDVIVFALAGELVHFQHGDERLGLHPPFFARILGRLAQWTGVEEAAMLAIVTVLQTVADQSLGPATQHVR